MSRIVIGFGLDLDWIDNLEKNGLLNTLVIPYIRELQLFI